MDLLQRAWHRVDRWSGAAAAAVVVVGVVVSVVAGGYADRLGLRYDQEVLDRRAAVASWALQGEVSRYHDAVAQLAAAVGAQQDLDSAGFAALTAPLRSARLTGASSAAFIVATDDDAVAEASSFWQARGASPFLPGRVGRARVHRLHHPRSTAG